MTGDLSCTAAFHFQPAVYQLSGIALSDLDVGCSLFLA
jgi:hypothetical protein